MSKQTNSFADNMRRTITAQTNTIALLESIQSSISTKDTIVSYDYENLKDGSISTYQLPSYVSVNNRLKAVERNINNLASGKATLTLNDGSRRQIKLTNLPQTPEKISTLDNPTTFSIDSNWFFEDLMFPGITVKVDLTGQIEESSDRVKVSRIILDANKAECQQIWRNNLANTNYTYPELKAVLAYNNIVYSEDIQTVNLPLVSNTLSGEFQIMADPEIINGNTWYKLDTIGYKTINEDGTDQGVNNVLSIGDQLAYDNTLFSIVEIDQNNYKVRLKVLSGAAFPGVFSVFKYYQDPFRNKVIDVRIGAHEYDIVYVKGVNEDFNLLADQWSNPIKFATDELVYENDVNLPLSQYYIQYVTDWGSQWIAEAKERRLSAYYGHTPNIPTLSATDLRVVQINTQINAAISTADIRATASEIEATKTLIESKKSTISAQKSELQSITSTDEYTAKQDEISTNTIDLQNLQTQYTSLVKSFQAAVKENQAVIEDPKYHIRGFFPIPVRMFRDDNKTLPEEIIGFEIMYRYLKEDTTGQELNTFEYTDTDGNSIVSGTFTDWIMMQSPMKQRVWNPASEMYEWQTENVADGSQININQIDIPITKGEKVEIKARTISEAGYPDNPLKSDWSESIVISFPPTLSTRNAMADLVQEINDDALNIAIQNNLDSTGVTAHLADTIPNVNSVNGIYFNHIAANIAYEDEDNGVISSVSLQSKVSDLEARLKLLESYIDSQTTIVTQ